MNRPSEPFDMHGFAHQVFGIAPLPQPKPDRSVIPIRPNGEKVVLQAIADELSRTDRAPVLFEADRASADHECLEELRTLLEAGGYYQRPKDDGQIDWTVGPEDVEDRYGHDD